MLQKRKSLRKRAQQSVHPTLGIRRHFQAFSYALSFFQLDGFAVPAPARVTQTVGWQSQRANAKPYLIRRFRFAIGAEIQNHFFSGRTFQASGLGQYFSASRFSSSRLFLLAAFSRWHKFRFVLSSR